MFPFRGGVATGLFCVGLLLAGTLPAARAQEGGENERLRKARLTVMEQAVAGFKISRTDNSTPPAFAAQPLLRYSDPTRAAPGASGLLDATVWRLGEKGRPAGLLTIEIYGGTPESAILSYEFAALADGELSLSHTLQKDLAWQTPGRALTMRPLSGASQPAETLAARLGQMRQLVRRFKVTETYEGVPTQCRLLAQPIDRYRSADSEIIDGALFAFANGTNPEIGVLVECGKVGWSYGLARLSAAESKVELDGTVIATFAGGDFRLVRRGAYLAHHHPIPVAK